MAGGVSQEQISVIGDFNDKSLKFITAIERVNNSPPFEVRGRRTLRKSASEPDINTFLARAVLPWSGGVLSAKQAKGEDQLFDLRLKPTKEGGSFPEAEYQTKRQTVTMGFEDLEQYLQLLRLVQVSLTAHTNSNRLPAKQAEDESEGCLPLPTALTSAIMTLEDMFTGGSNSSEVSSAFNLLKKYLLDQLERFKLEIVGSGLTLAGALDEAEYLYSEQFLKSFCNITVRKEQIKMGHYLEDNLDSTIILFVQDAIYEGLKQMFRLPPPRVIYENVKVNLPELKVRLNPTLNDPYQDHISDLERLSSVPNIDAKILNDIKRRAKAPNDIKKLVSDPPSKIQLDIDRLLDSLGGDAEKIFAARLGQTCPGVFEYYKNKRLGIKEIYTKTDDLRKLIAKLDREIGFVDKEVETIGQSKSESMNVSALRTGLLGIKKAFTGAKNSDASVERVVEELNKVQNELKSFKGKLTRKLTNISTEGSVYWVGLGQAGQTILRECLLYCMENLNDARCSALIRALGIKDIHHLNELYLKSKDADSDKRSEAEQEMKQICNDDLHVLAINLGNEIDELVHSSQPGHYLWGDEIPEADYNTVRRTTMNTIKLDTSGQGTGGTTGVGRAFAFSREQELATALKDTATKNMNEPSHIIVVHSFAGGSGSGMVLPVLQYMRGLFDKEAMIWVLSAGEGLSENRPATPFNTPFILSDVLQAHYDGIHSPRDPFAPHDWEIQRDEVDIMAKTIKSSLDAIGEALDFDNVEDLLEGLKSTNRAVIQSHVAKRDLALNKMHAQGYRPWVKSETKGETEQCKFEFSDVSSWFVELLPDAHDEEVEDFNQWCSRFDDFGLRPALEYWHGWLQGAMDPLGRLLDCREDKKEVNKQDSQFDFSPNLTGAHIELALDEAWKKIHPEETSSEMEKQKSRSSVTGVNLLMSFIESRMNSSESIDFEQVREAFETYGRAVDEYNKHLRDLTYRIQALAKSGNDLAVKSIVVSNAHLEQGVNDSKIPVSDKSYTVYNSVVFDLIMNIIGSQLPSDDFTSAKMEFFDRQDLNNQTRPPMVVGLLHQNDALSLGESFTANREGKHMDDLTSKLFNSILIEQTIIDEVDNPIREWYPNVRAGRRFQEFIDSFFGRRWKYLAQQSPFSMIGNEVPSALKPVIDALMDHWETATGPVLDLKPNERKLLLDAGVTPRVVSNLFLWISSIEPSVLSKVLDIDASEHTVDRNIKFDFVKSPRNTYLSNYEDDNGRIDKSMLTKTLPKLGIWSEDILAATPPAWLNSYLPYQILLQYRNKISEDLVEPLQAAYEAINHDDPFTDGEALVDAILSNYRPTNAVEPKDMAHDFDEDLDDVVGVLFDELEHHNEKVLKVFEDHNLALTWKAKEDSKRQTGDRDEELLLRLHPRLRRYLSAFRDSMTSHDQQLLPSTSPAGNLERFITPDNDKTSVGPFSAPKFQRSISLLPHLGFMGLLPDEHRLTWSSLLRMLLFTQQADAKGFLNALSESTSTEVFTDEMVKAIDDLITKHQMPEINLEHGSDPEAIVSLAQTLHGRLIAAGSVAASTGSSNFTGLEYWEEFSQDFQGEDAPTNTSELKRYCQFLMNTVMQNNPAERSHATEMEESAGMRADEEESVREPSEAQSSKAIDQMSSNLSTNRLLFEVASFLNEALNQAEYMSKETSPDHVHFPMNGFTDRIIGHPSGMLVQVHTESTYLGNFDAVSETIRKSVIAAIGAFGDNTKEFQTKSYFGPKATTTITFQKAPLNEAAESYRRLIKSLEGDQAEEYRHVTKLHPYVFLYNILWLSARLDQWTSPLNTGFGKKFIIPQQVIENHYQNPNRLKEAGQVLAKDAAFRAGITVPRNDIGDFRAVLKDVNEPYRSIPFLLGVMALRHYLAVKTLSKDDKINENFKGKCSELLEKLEAKVEHFKDNIMMSEAASHFTSPRTLQALVSDKEWKVIVQRTQRTRRGKGRSGAGAVDYPLLKRTEAWFSAYDQWASYELKEEDVL